MADKLTGRLSKTSDTLYGRISDRSLQLRGRMSTYGGVIRDHGLLENRDGMDQHPIGSITNLEAELEYRPSSALTNVDIQAILEM